MYYIGKRKLIENMGFTHRKNEQKILVEQGLVYGGSCVHLVGGHLEGYISEGKVFVAGLIDVEGKVEREIQVYGGGFETPVIDDLELYLMDQVIYKKILDNAQEGECVIELLKKEIRGLEGKPLNGYTCIMYGKIAKG